MEDSKRAILSAIDFADFCWGVHHITISTHYPHSNGAAQWAGGTA